MPKTYLTLQIQNENRAFKTGDTIKGVASISTTDQCVIHSLTVALRGIVKCSWSRPTPIKPHIKHYSKKERIYFHEINVIGTTANGEQSRESNAKTSALKQQTSAVNSFAFYLPNDLLSSYQGKYGHVKYFIQAEVKTSDETKKSEKQEVVIQRRTLGLEQTVISEETFPVKFWPSVKAIFSINLPTTTFAGDLNSIVVNAAENRLSKKIQFQLYFMQVLRYNTDEGFMDDRKTIMKSEKVRIGKDTTGPYGIHLMLPYDLQPSSIDEDEPVHISYEYVICISMNILRAFQKHMPVKVGVK